MKLNPGKLNTLATIILMGIAGCTSDEAEIMVSPKLQSMELHLPGGQVDTDLFVYSGDTLSSHIRSSTGWTDILIYNFEYDNLSTLVYFDQNGVPAADFIKKEDFNSNNLRLKTVINEEDGSQFATYDYVYNDALDLVAQLVESEGSNYTDSITVDDTGNVLAIKRIEDGSLVKMTFDDHPNPFYQMPVIINMFRTDSPNNITSFQLYYGDDLFYEKTFSYQYDANGMPTKIEAQGSLSTDPAEVYDLNY